jgi:tRNA threonylcarbamoyladenosine modification (KEOPS) complex  Pcc1 subunit
VAIRSTLRINLEEYNLAEKLYRALLPEAETTKSRGAKIALKVEEGVLVMEIEAVAIAPLRALLNSYIRWVCISLDIVTLKGD